MASDLVLVIGAADTGRAPMTAAMLRRRLQERGYRTPVESAGVLGHDGDSATAEAIAAIEQMGLDISDHRARSLTEDLAAAARLMIAVDSGTAKVARARFPDASARIQTLGELAGRPRDIPDPFKMQIGAWLIYAREIDSLIGAALPRILEQLGAPAEPAAAPPPEPPAAQPQVAPERAEAVDRIVKLVQLAAQMPGVVDWSAARAQIEADLERISGMAAGPADLCVAYAGLLRAALALTPAPPSAARLAALGEGVARLAAPVDQEALTRFSAQLGGWSSLA